MNLSALEYRKINYSIDGDRTVPTFANELENFMATQEHDPNRASNIIHLVTR